MHGIFIISSQKLAQLSQNLCLPSVVLLHHIHYLIGVNLPVMSTRELPKLFSQMLFKFSLLNNTLSPLERIVASCFYDCHVCVQQIHQLELLYCLKTRIYLSKPKFQMTLMVCNSMCVYLMLHVFVCNISWHIASFSYAQVQVISVKCKKWNVNNIA